ncbi:hypothetical protein NGTWS1803_05200 [Mycolicibacterium cyprinidarum]|nr:hypothetical protein NGTWS1803_05200 [Mycolicibacterium sp. NGTWS1803]
MCPIGGSVSRVFSGVHLKVPLVWWVRATVGVVLIVVALDWAGWAKGIEALTRGLPSWPQMTPWTALLLAGLAIAILVQSGRPWTPFVWAGRGLAVVVGVLALGFLAQYATGFSFGIDTVWFSEPVQALQESWPGRPSPRTAASALLLAVAVGLTRLDRPWVRVAWPVLVAAAATLPLVAVLAYLFDTLSMVGVTRSTGMGISTALGLLLLSVATLMARPDRNPAAWLLARPDRRTLIRLIAITAGLPILVGLSRLLFLTLGLRDDPAWVLSIAVSTIVLGMATFYLSQHEQKLLIDKEVLSSQRADAEARYRILADNAVDIVVHLHGTVVHLHGTAVAWVSPSVQTAFGDPPQQWIGSDFSSRIHPDDREEAVAALQTIAPGNPVVTRFRIGTADHTHHWVEGHGKSYVDAEGNTDGVIVALRVVDDQVQTEQQLQKLARFDPLTGLVNRGEALARLETALTHPRSSGSHLGLLFCDVDRFKAVNDTWGHAVGDLVLSTLAARIRQCVRQGDTVGRTGGDEILVQLPNLHSLEEAVQIAEKIRAHAAEPIDQDGKTIYTTVSIGVTLAVPGESILALTARADKAMYQAKDAGRNTVTCI